MHVQQSGRRFATGGVDALVKVWSLAPVLDARKEAGGPLALATLSDHSSAVNTVRFSKNGKLLASGTRQETAAGIEQQQGSRGGQASRSAALLQSNGHGTGPVTHPHHAPNPSTTLQAPTTA